MEARTAKAIYGLSPVWAGMLIGVSFLATQATFLAPSLSLQVALDVGRQTFALFGTVEVVCGTLLLAATMLVRSQRRTLLLAASATAAAVAAAAVAGSDH